MANPWDPVPQAPDDSPPTYYSNAPAPTSGGGSGYYTGGNPWNTGYSGTKGGVGTQTGPSAPPKFPWDAYRAANQQSQNAAEQGLAALMGGMSVNTPFGQYATNQFMNPQGLPPHLLQQQQRMMADTFAGSRENALMRSQQGARASGFGDSLGAQRMQDMIRSQSASDLNNAQMQLAIQDAMMARQSQMGFGGLAAQLYGIDAGLRGQYAQGQLGRQFPVIPGQTGPGGPGGQSQTPWQSPGWSQSGQWMPQGVGADPFYGGGGPGTGQGTGYTAQNPWKAW